MNKSDVANLNIFKKIYLSKCYFYPGKRISTTNHNKNYNILILCTVSKFDGLINHIRSFYEAHLQEGYNAHILVPHNSEIEKLLIKKNLPFYSFTRSRFFKPYNQLGITSLVKAIVQKEKINIIHCNRHKEIKMLKKIDKKQVKIILTRHSPSVIRTKYLKAFPTIFCVDINLIPKIKERCKQKKITCPDLHFMPPFFNADSLLKDQAMPPQKSKYEFFKEEFGIDLPPYPIITIVANLYGYKNHQLMLRALHRLIFDKKIKISLMLCGDGYRKNYLKLLTRKLKIEEYVHFLGFTYKRIDVMRYADINALVTKDEAFGIVMMEAALLKKALLGPSQTGVISTIIDKKTGLLFQNGNEEDLADKIEILLKNPELCKQLGQAAYLHVKQNLLPTISIRKINKFYKENLN